MDETFEVAGAVWRWRPNQGSGGGWYFLTIAGQAAAEIRYATLGRSGGFGSIRVVARIGGTTWTTSIFPHRETGGFVLPLKADVRRREDVGDGGVVEVSLQLA